jgi:hypothetical protein
VIRRFHEARFARLLHDHMRQCRQPLVYEPYKHKLTPGALARKLAERRREARDEFFRKAVEALLRVQAKRKGKQRVVPAEPFRAPVLEKRGKRWVAMR